MGIAISIVAITGATTILWSLWDGRAGNLMFDGASLCMYALHLHPPTLNNFPSFVLLCILRLRILCHTQ